MPLNPGDQFVAPQPQLEVAERNFDYNLLSTTTFPDVMAMPITRITLNGVPLGNGTYGYIMPTTFRTSMREIPAEIQVARWQDLSTTINTNLRYGLDGWGQSLQQFNTQIRDFSFTLTNFNWTWPDTYSEKPRKRAKRLLYSCLTNYQKRTYRQNKWFHVTSNKGRKYRISHGDTMNITLIEKGKPTKKYCIHPRNVPVEDTMLAQKLLIETNEDQFLKVANAA